MEDLDYLEEEEDLMVLAAVALVDALTATMDLGVVIAAAEGSVTVTGTVKEL